MKLPRKFPGPAQELRGTLGRGLIPGRNSSQTKSSPAGKGTLPRGTKGNLFLVQITPKPALNSEFPAQSQPAHNWLSLPKPAWNGKPTNYSVPKN